MARCADELFAIRNEMRSEFTYLRGKFDDVQGQMKDGAVKIALSSQRIEALQREIEALRKITVPTPLSNQTLHDRRMHWAGRSALQALIYLGVASLGGYILVGWGKHVAATGVTQGTAP